MPKGQQSLSTGATSGVKTFAATVMAVLSFLHFFFMLAGPPPFFSFSLVIFIISHHHI